MVFDMKLKKKKRLLVRVGENDLQLWSSTGLTKCIWFHQVPEGRLIAITLRLFNGNW